MFDPLTARYTFACPARGDVSVRLSAFRLLGRLPGAAHPAVYRVQFACSCGDEHVGLLAHDELDWAPLGLRAGVFLNLMTSRLEEAAGELGDLSARRIQAGEWPWSFYCHQEERTQPIYPSAFVVLAPASSRGAVGLAARCPACSGVSVNLVSAQHVDIPFFNDASVGVVDHIFAADAERVVEAFRDDLASGRFDERRLDL